MIRGAYTHESLTYDIHIIYGKKGHKKIELTVGLWSRSPLKDFPLHIFFKIAWSYLLYVMLTNRSITQVRSTLIRWLLTIKNSWTSTVIVNLLGAQLLIVIIDVIRLDFCLKSLVRCLCIILTWEDSNLTCFEVFCLFSIGAFTSNTALRNCFFLFWETISENTSQTRASLLG